MDKISITKIEEAELKDVSEMLSLYRIVYGAKYPISYGSDPKLLKFAIEEKSSHLVLVAKNNEKVVGALIVEIDTFNKIGKLVGLVVDPNHQRLKIGDTLVASATERLLVNLSKINSLYATTRTNSIGPQLVFVNNGYTPMGIFPNAHRLFQYETVTLFAKYREGILAKRIPLEKVTSHAIVLYQILRGLNLEIKIPEALFGKVNNSSSVLNSNNNNEEQFEIIQSPKYVLRKYNQLFPNQSDRFFPFHPPNILISDSTGSFEIFAYFNKQDGYCAFINSTKKYDEMQNQLTSLFMQLDDIGVSYIEILLDVRLTETIDVLVKSQFIPSALYPAMREIKTGEFEDYIVLSRTMELLNFKGMSIISQLEPFVDYYLESWKKVNLDSIEVYYAPKP